MDFLLSLVTYFSDNQATIFLVANLKYHKRTNYIDVVYDLIHKFQEHDKIIVSCINTIDQLANILTKASFPKSLSNYVQ